MINSVSRENVQNEIFKGLEQTLTPYYNYLIDDSNWRSLAYNII